MRGVPLARRNLFADRRRLAVSVVGVGLAVMLILLLDGMWAGMRAQARLYTDRASADLYVLQTGVRDLTAGTSQLPLRTTPPPFSAEARRSGAIALSRALRDGWLSNCARAKAQAEHES